MSVLSGKNILLGITAGIAAYKIPFLIRLLKKEGADVRVVMTPAAVDFVTPLTLAALSKNEVITSFTKEEEHKTAWNHHVNLALWADLMIIAPATANTLSKMVSGNSDNFLLATYLSAKCPVFFAPAMDLDMFRHPSTRHSFEKLQAYGNVMIPAETGELASGLTGEGRMAEPEKILSAIQEHFSAHLALKGKKILITAGPTYEPIDPVRYIGNRSSGKMGLALATAAAELGAEVILVLGPTQIQVPDGDLKIIHVETAQQMLEEVLQHFDSADAVIAAAAVSDYRPIHSSPTKIKKTGEQMQIALQRNPDILATLGTRRKNQILVGFALETDQEHENARLKLERKNLNFIVLNSLRDSGAGFGWDTNQVEILYRDGRSKKIGLKSKKEIACDIIEELKLLFHV